jgi:energy-coupling factor transporter ATP-binding protein EcfA2
VLPPVAPGPCFTIRKPAARIYTLRDYVSDGLMPHAAALVLSQAVTERRNILVVGGTSSGKTTLANALLGEMAELDERVILIEDTRELQSPARDTVALRTRAAGRDGTGSITMGDLVRSTLRLRPDRIIIGEVRGPEALDMLKAWNTGHPGGIATVHANSAPAALYRIEQLVQEAWSPCPQPDRRGHRPHRLHRRARHRAPHRDHRPCGGARWRGRVPADRPYPKPAHQLPTHRRLTHADLPHSRPPPSHRPHALLAMALGISARAFASGTGMPWETPLQNILDPCRARSPRSLRC